MKDSVEDLSRISQMIKPLCMLLEKNVPFIFEDKCLLAIQTLKGALISTSIIVALD